jgi:hypothetical protein
VSRRCSTVRITGIERAKASAQVRTARSRKGRAAGAAAWGYGKRGGQEDQGVDHHRRPDQKARQQRIGEHPLKDRLGKKAPAAGHHHKLPPMRGAEAGVQGQGQDRAGEDEEVQRDELAHAVRPGGGVALCQERGEGADQCFLGDDGGIGQRDEAQRDGQGDAGEGGGDGGLAPGDQRDQHRRHQDVVGDQRKARDHPERPPGGKQDGGVGQKSRPARHDQKAAGRVSGHPVRSRTRCRSRRNWSRWGSAPRSGHRSARR